MSDQSTQWVSELVDGELPGEELSDKIRWLGSNREALAAWDRYHLISDTMRKNLPETLCLDFSARVMAGITEDSSIQAHWAEEEVGIRHKIWGVGLAASIAVATVAGAFALMPRHQPGGQVDQVAGGATTQILGSATEQTLASTVPPTIPQREGYLVNHNELATRASMPGMMPYARLVSHGQKK